MKKNLLWFISGILLTLTVGATASILYNASEIEFSPSNSEWNVNNVENAINDLYDKCYATPSVIFKSGEVNNLSLYKTTGAFNITDSYVQVYTINDNSNGNARISSGLIQFGDYKYLNVIADLSSTRGGCIDLAHVSVGSTQFTNLQNKIVQKYLGTSCTSYNRSLLQIDVSDLNEGYINLYVGDNVGTVTFKIYEIFLSN